ncbi:HNH endonuclease [Soonwooa purpurea]
MADKRISISKKIRFEVLKRDGFTCQYCSAKPPKVPLEVDHIMPVCKGGKNNIDNLITACFDCNRGKSGIELTSVPETILEKSEGKKLALKQYKEYQKILQMEKMQMEIDIDSVEMVYMSIFEGYIFTPKFRISVKDFISKLGVNEVVDAMEKACNKMYDEDHALRYFCGICWTQIREKL